MRLICSEVDSRQLQARAQIKKVKDWRVEWNLPEFALSALPRLPPSESGFIGG
jgi:hypothetical protein